MFKSRITAADLIERIKDEADIAYPIPDPSYIAWLNSTEQLLYTELIREQGKIELENVSDFVPLANLASSEGESTVRFEDIHAVYAGKVQLIKSTAASGVIFCDTYYKADGGIGLNLRRRPQKLTVIYFVRPRLKTEDNIGTEHVMLPDEFVELVGAKLRGEAYKVVNEDGIAAKWLSDYNALLETFKTWLAGKQPEFGL